MMSFFVGPCQGPGTLGRAQVLWAGPGWCADTGSTGVHACSLLSTLLGATHTV
jgi:hypothetical protein